MITKQDKDDIEEIVGDAFRDVILPLFEDVATKKDLDQVEVKLGKRLTTVETRLEVVDRKLDRVLDNQLVDKSQLSDHEKRIKILESRRVVA